MAELFPRVLNRDGEHGASCELGNLVRYDRERRHDRRGVRILIGARGWMLIDAGVLCAKDFA